MIIALVILSIFVIVSIVGIIHLYKRSERIKQNDKPEPTKKYDFIVRGNLSAHQGVHPHIVYDKYYDEYGNKHLKSVSISHEPVMRKKKNPIELKYDINPWTRLKKAYVIHEIVDKKATTYKKRKKYQNYSLSKSDKKLLIKAIEKWETEPNNYTEAPNKKFQKARSKRRRKIKTQSKHKK